MKIIFTRHGESYANVIREISNTGLKHPLTHTGRRQANDLADHLEPHAITRIYSSPTLRAIETSVIVANRLNLNYEATEALREIDHGVLEGRSDEAAWQMMGEISSAWKLHQQWGRRIEGGESFIEVRQRFVPFVQGLIEQYGATDEAILCVAHGGLYSMMLPLVLANITEDVFSHHELTYTVLIEARLTPAGLICVSWNGVPL